MKLVAPNGKPSKLTAEQYRLVRTSAFKNWFGDWENSPETASKVVDENGEPLVVWHGSPYKNFTVFDDTTRGIWFSVKKDIAITYRDTRLDDWKNEYKGKELKELIEGRGIFFTFLKSKKIYDLSKYDVTDIITQEEFKKLFPKSNYNGSYFNKNLPHWEFFEFDYENIKKWILNSGYDCIKIKELGVITYCVFKPEQIKLADGTNTTFDGNNSDIRYADGGIINDFKYTIGGL